MKNWLKARINRRALVVVFLLTCPPALAQSGRVLDDHELEQLLSVEHLPPYWFTLSPEEQWAEPADSWWMSFSNWVLSQERHQGSRIQRLGEWADRTLSGSSRSLPDNESYLRIGFATESEYGDPAQFEPEARFRLDVPTVKEKLRVVIESESEDLIPLAERRRDRQLTEDDRSDTQTTGALRFLSEVGDAINLGMDVGARLRLPPDAFWRISADKRWKLDDDWYIRLEQRAYYYHQDGWGSRFWGGVGRDVGSGWDFVAISEIEWIHRKRKYEFSQTFNFFKRLNNRSTIAPRLGILGESQPQVRETNLFADLTWRYRLHDDWLFAEVIPAVEFPREDSFKDRGSLILRIELFFSGNIRR
jgi:hypothetical protein